MLGYFMDTTRFNIATYKIKMYDNHIELINMYKEKNFIDSTSIQILKNINSIKDKQLDSKDSIISNNNKKIVILDTKVKVKNTSILVLAGVIIIQFLISNK